MAQLFQTPRLMLRPWQPDDADGIWTLFSDAAVMWWGPLRDRPAAAKMLAGFVAHNQSGHFALRVSARGDDRLLGNVMLKPAAFADGIEIAYHFAPSARGQGFATEAAGALCAHGLSQGLERIIAAVVPDNDASIRVLQRLSFVRVGEVMHADLSHDLYERRGAPLVPVAGRDAKRQPQDG